MRSWTSLAVVALMFLCGAVAGARIFRVPGGAAEKGTVNLPYNINDNQGNNWQFYQNGWFRQQGNIQIYSQGGTILINGNYPNVQVNTAKLDEKTGELIFENMQGQNCLITRRIQVNKEDGYIRMIDIIKNTQGQDQTLNVMVQTQMNYSVNSASNVPDPRNKNNNVGWVGNTSGNKTVAEIFCGRGSKVVPNINYQQGNSYVQATLALPVPANKEVAIMHVHSMANSQDQATKWINGIRESKLMSDIPSAIRKMIVNFRAGNTFIGEFEILRGEMLDVVELRGGDQLRGTIKEQSFKIQTFYGPIELKADNVISLINVGEFRPRQLLVTKDGQIFGGEMEKKELSIELSSGQITPVPIGQLTRAGYRKRPNEPEEWTFDKSVVVMRTGERMLVETPAKDLDVLTRYGAMKLRPDAVAAVTFQNEEHGVHEIYLCDGSKFAGLVTADVFDMKLTDGGQAVKFPASGVSRLQVTGKVDESDDTTPTLSLANDDQLIGTLAGQLKLDTAFSTITLNAGEIRRMAHAKAGMQDVQVVLWDDTTVSGQLQEQDIACKLKCGVAMKVPVALLEEYNNPRPQPSASVIEQIKKIAADLDNDDFKVREDAQKKLMSMGNVVVSVLQEMRAKLGTEGQSRVDKIIKELGGAAPKPSPTPGASGGEGAANPPAQPVPVPDVQIEVLPQGLQMDQLKQVDP